MFLDASVLVTGTYWGFTTKERFTHNRIRRSKKVNDVRPFFWDSGGSSTHTTPWTSTLEKRCSTLSSSTCLYTLVFQEPYRNWGVSGVWKGMFLGAPKTLPPKTQVFGILGPMGILNQNWKVFCHQAIIIPNSFGLIQENCNTPRYRTPQAIPRQRQLWKESRLLIACW